ncbi:MAG: histidine phosphatase family protein [Ilumatobacteraceae bacterium]
MLILVRHGRTSVNAGGRLQGHADFDIDGVGRAQVAAMVAKVGVPDRVISSPLQRARHTAEAFGVPYEVDERWKEINYGQFEGMLMSDIPAADLAQWRADEGFAPPGGESLRDLGLRVRAACLDLMTEAMDRTVVVTSHVSPIKAAVAWALDAPMSIAWRCRLGQAAICRISCTPLGPVLVGFNEPSV